MNQSNRPTTGADHVATDGVISDLVQLLHQGAPAEDFAMRLARIEALPEDVARKASLTELVRMAMAIRNRLDLQQQRERGMLALIESAQDLSSRLDVADLLRAIVSRARNLLGSHVAWLSTYDSDRDEFHVVVAEGGSSQSTGKMVAKRDFGVASVIMSTRAPFTTADYLHDTRFRHDPKLDDTFRQEGLTTLIGAPLFWADEVIGLLFVADCYHRAHTALNMSILSTLAIHAAVAIKNAKAFEETSAALRDVELSRAEVERHARHVNAAAEAHEQLTSLLASGASIATLCQSIADLLEGSILVLDEAGRVISRGTAPGYGGTAAEGYSPNDEHSGDVVRALRSSRPVGRSVVAYEANGELCRVISVIGGNEVLGAVLLFRQSDLDEISIRTFERSATVIGIALLSQDRMEANKSRDVSNLLRSLVSPRHDNPENLSDFAERFGLQLTQPLALILIEMDDPKAGYAARRLRGGAPLADVVLDEIDGVLAIVCGATKADKVLQTIASFARRELNCVYRGVLSRPVSTPAEMPALYATLRRALSVLRRIGVQGHIVAQNEMALYSVLFETHDQASLTNFLDTIIGPLLSHDGKKGSELTTTLLTYFDCNQNAKATARCLGIHFNTVRQRLANIEELLGHWGNATRALEIHMALRLWSLSAGGQSRKAKE